MAKRPAVIDRNERVLVTGGAGFLGRHVVAELERRGFSNFTIPRRSEHDLTRQDVVEELLSSARPDVVIHLAAEVGGIGANRANPGRYFYANAVMGINLIEASHARGVAKFVQAGTVCSYPKYSPVPFSEDEIWNGFPEETNAPYGIAKRSLLMMLQAYRAQYGFNGIFVLPANLYGPGDNFDPETSHVIAALIRRFVEAASVGLDEVTLWGSGTVSREFLHVRDAARGVVSAALEYDDPAPVNLGTGSEIVIRDLAGMIADKVGFNGSIGWDTTMPDGQPRRSLDTTRADERFGFQAEIGLAMGLDETIAWWRQHTRGER